MRSWAGASKATPSTTCQKCLKKGHYSYECTASQQDRPYISRPSRSQQMSNPKLAPKIHEQGVKPPETVAAITKRSKPKETLKEADQWVERARRRSEASSDSDSVSTISTNRSRSRSRDAQDMHRPRTERRYTSDKRRRQSRSSASDSEHGTRERQRPGRRDGDPAPKRHPRERSDDNDSEHGAAAHSSRRRSRSRSPFRHDDHREPQRQRDSFPRPSQQPGRSPSPYSKRQALARNS